MKMLAYLFLVILVLGSWGYLNSEWLVDRVSTSPIVQFWNGEDLPKEYVERPHARILNPLKPMHDPIEYYPAPAPVYREGEIYAMAPPPPAPAPVVEYAPAPAPIEMPTVTVTATPLEKKIWDNPLINSLVIPLALYFGKKWIDLFFARMEKAHAT